MHWIKDVISLILAFGMLLRRLRNEARRLRAVAKLRNNNPLARIDVGVIVIGDPDRIKLGKDTVVEDGVVFDMQFGGSVIFGDRNTIRTRAIINPFGGSIQFGDDCGIQYNTIIYGHGGLVVGDLVRFAANCLVVPMNHGVALNGTPIHFQPLSLKGITMGSDIWVGGGVVILDGVSIHDGAVIGAGSVVTNSVSENTIVVGVPSRTIKQRG